jgi:hypothetical protein
VFTHCPAVRCHNPASHPSKLLPELQQDHRRSLFQRHMPLHPSQIVLIFHSPVPHCKTMAHKPPDAEALFAASYSRYLPVSISAAFSFIVCAGRAYYVVSLCAVWVLSFSSSIWFLVGFHLGMWRFWFVAARL